MTVGYGPEGTSLDGGFPVYKKVSVWPPTTMSTPTTLLATSLSMMNPNDGESTLDQMNPSITTGSIRYALRLVNVFMSATTLYPIADETVKQLFI